MKSWRFNLLVLGMGVALSACGQTPAATATKPQAASSVPGKPTTVLSVTQDVPEQTAKTITANLEQNYATQNLKVKSIANTPISGIYEVVLDGKQVVYTDTNGHYMLVGDLIDTQTKTSLTEERQSQLNAIDFDALPLEKAIKEVRGNGELKVAVFSDADCPYCRRLEREFAKMDNITIYNFMMPIPSLHPDAHRKSVQIWCQPDRTVAWTQWMREGKSIPNVAECNNPIAETTALGESFGFNGTPTIVFPNGKVQAGFSPMPHLAEIIKQNQK
ncbi:MAG: DsbC family protein [Alysiella sp.]|uniref:DsbC family protein n=1 Tax=Alysiella sp. TaxID=1872483 RepID=UPI0026DB3AB6|nr:DsbC family protein [Alysiella sp.]MDO4433660.1 DsbC family protein [Alysiella sp.]